MSKEIWQPSASLRELRQRGALLRSIREYFYRNGVLEVETPMLSRYATVDPQIESFQTNFVPLGTHIENKLYLHTSPEFPMKRLLAAGSGDIYFLGRVFRNGEAGGRHNPEFTMLEWYRVDRDHHQLMDDVTALLGSVTNFSEVGRYTYKELFEDKFRVDPHTATGETLMGLVHQYIDSKLKGLAAHDCLDLLFSICIEPDLGGYVDGQIQGVYVYDYPASRSALSRIVRNGQGQRVAARFELFAHGYELANGYHELADGHEQQARFEQDLQERESFGRPVCPWDQHLVAALEHGFPDCAGVAMGVDRLHMLIAGEQAISAVIPFAFDRA